MKRPFSIPTRLVLAFALLISVLSPLSRSAAADSARIGLFIGTFDPFHAQHAELAIKAKRELGLNQVFIVPNASNPKKPLMTSLRFRHRLIAAALKDIRDPNLHLLEVEEIQASDPGNNQTLFAKHIISLLQKRFPNAILYEILGSDSIEKVLLNSMPKPADKVVLVVMDRPSVPIKRQPALQRFKDLGLFVEITPGTVSLSSTEIRKAAKTGNLEFLQTNLSPSLYRELLFKGAYGLRQTPVWEKEVLRLIRLDRQRSSPPLAEGRGLVPGIGD